MPGRNGMGPMGQGPMTGGGRGGCGGAEVRTEVRLGESGFGMGRGYGYGGGWRRRHRWHGTGPRHWQRVQMGWPDSETGLPTDLSKEQELAALKQQTRSLEQTVGDLKSRIQRLDASISDASEKA
jgi:hypothetical protein